MKKMMKTLGLLLLGLTAVSAAAGTGSCVGRCGEVFTRGQRCTCDLGCLQHNECCPDYQTTCTTAQSCQGRCGEAFRRGLPCECDPLCVLFHTCCHDYRLHCDASVTVSQRGSSQPQRATASRNSRNWKPERTRKTSNSESEEWFTGRGRCPQSLGARCHSRFGSSNPQTAGSSGLTHPARPTNHQQHGGRNIPVGLLPVPPSRQQSLPSNSAPALGSRAPVSPSTPESTGGGKLNVHLVMLPVGVGPSGPSQGAGGPAGSGPSTLLNVAPHLGLSVMEGGLDMSGLLADVDLCSDSPINGLTALSNGTILIFKGEFFWSVDPISLLVGPPHNITETLGVPSPIDTIFTRLGCNGNTYIIKGDQYWRLDGNMVMQPGYPKPLSFEFPGLTGSISAVLAVPATRTSPEIVFFFKEGDIIQRFIFPSGSAQSCAETPRTPPKRHLAGQADALLSGEINIRVSLQGFPTPITSALSMPSPQSVHHFVFSGPLYFRVQISGDLPALVKPDPLAPVPILSPVALGSSTAGVAGRRPNALHPPNSIRFWLRCP
ncbi:proteoglycan 4a [Kryptolebias marmoratus]|uniref:proteoglycan 4a n=1 Tax=Kryptolebias marmoratus TaxID=37003 RepID=UPI0007F8EE51|nr:proteoglycan 4a [Kryptolebias marmoratus]